MRKIDENHKDVIQAKVLIIGGGVGGCGVGLEYIKSVNANKPDTIPSTPTLIDHLNKKHSVMIVDANELLSGTSSITPGHAGLGFHYKHLPTAKMYLNATLSIALDYQTKMVGGNAPASHYLKRGRYFITKDSQETPKNLLKLYEELRKEYAKFAEKHPTIEDIFGPPADFFRILAPSEYKDDINNDKITMGIETAEQLLDWPEFKATLRKKVYESGIKVEEKCQVTHLEYGRDCFLVATNKDFLIKADLIINAAWQNIELLNRQLNFIMPKGYRTNRLKALAKVELPNSLKERSSMFFCMGPHCMFSNMGDGTALMSYAPETNLESSTTIDLPEKSQRYLSGKMAVHEKMAKGLKIIQGVSQYIPNMQHAKLLDVRTGIVKSLGEVDIFSHESKVHERDYSGVEVQQIGYISNACMKLLYIFENGKKVSNLINRHFQLSDEISDCIDNELANYPRMQQKILKPLFLLAVKRYSQIEKIPEVRPYVSGIFAAAKQRTKACKAIELPLVQQTENDILRPSQFSQRIG